MAARSAWWVVITIRRMRLGSGFRYLMESVAAGDGGARRGDNLTRYYSESGTPPGIFLGAGLGSLGEGRGIEPGTTVTEEHLWRMLGMMADPLTGQPLGTVPRAGSKIAAVAGFDLTFSPPKSVSTAWALADERTRQVIYECHRKAIDFILSYAEREVLHSRSGTNGIIQEDVAGVIAVSFTHFDSRSGDPQLHDHVVVWNRARSLSDGVWRTLDSRGLFKSVIALSEMHQGVLSDYLTRALGVGWEARGRRISARPRWEIRGVPETLLAEFSRRNKQIEACKDRMIAQFVATTGRQPTSVEVLGMRRQATLVTRPEKQHRSLEIMTSGWSARAAAQIGTNTGAWVESLNDRNDLPLLGSADLAEEILSEAARAATLAVSERRSVYSRANLLAETHRILAGVRFASPDDRIAVAEQVVELGVKASLDLSVPELFHTPGRFRRRDGSSRLRSKGYEIYTTPQLLDAEVRLLEAGRAVDAPAAHRATVAAMAGKVLPGRDVRLSVEQALAVEKIATSGRRVDVLVGPAGTGKSTAMAGLRSAWEREHGPGSVIGLAPSAAAAEVLADELGIETENTAKWLTEYRLLPQRIAQRDAFRRRVRAAAGLSPVALRTMATLNEEISCWQLRPGQLVIVDEASLAGTFALDELVGAAIDADAKVLLVGDSAQLSGVEAGGAFAMLASDRGALVPNLSDVRRFSSDWEKTASIGLRQGHHVAIDTYQTHGRIQEGDRDEMLDALYLGWKTDVESGRSSLMIAGDAETVNELNRRARADLIASGDVIRSGLDVACGQTAGVGDLVVTRQNNRRLISDDGRWVKNGDRWIVTGTDEDGAMTLRRANGACQIRLPARYVSVHVELAYATTAHRAQGATYATAHALVSPSNSREMLYVAATRGRESNRVYVDTSYDPDPSTGHEETQPAQSARQVLARILANEGADLSAHETIRRAQHAAESWNTLEAEYQVIAAAAQAERWDRLIARTGLTESEQLRIKTSPSRGALHAALRDAEAIGLDVRRIFPQLARGGLDETDDPAAVLHSRVDNWVRAAKKTAGSTTSDLIAGLLPRAACVEDPDDARALAEREEAMETRARTLADQAVSTGQIWVRKLGQPPVDRWRRARWMGAVATVAAYREGWDVGHDGRILGPAEMKSVEQLSQLERAQLAVEVALALVRQDSAQPLDSEVTVPYVSPGIVREGRRL